MPSSSTPPTPLYSSSALPGAVETSSPPSLLTSVHTLRANFPSPFGFSPHSLVFDFLSHQDIGFCCLHANTTSKKPIQDQGYHRTIIGRGKKFASPFYFLLSCGSPCSSEPAEWAHRSGQATYQSMTLLAGSIVFPGHFGSHISDQKGPKFRGSHEITTLKLGSEESGALPHCA